ncbi:MAG TPA: 30S ribosomal protein S1 [Desulfosalsimonadaceae bacterium]|nr:30S ribosomal protein S1 [Desulfosalsimonadaceae bacterium]
MTEKDWENPEENPNPDSIQNGSEDANTSEDFESLFESYMTDMRPDIRVGDKISGEIIVIGQDSVFLNTGSKIDGVVDKSELVDENGEFHYKVGDQLDLYVVAAGDGELQLSKTIGSSGSSELLYDALQNSIPVEGKVTETCKGGFKVQVMGKTAFCPISQMDTTYVEKPEAYVGATLEFLIERIEEKGRNVVVNRRKYLERLLAEERKKFLQQVSPGDTVNGKVTKLMPYGAFVELHPGVEGMVHISELSWSRVADPAEAVSVGDPLPVKILSINEADPKSGGLKISLSAKQVSSDPWETAAERFHAGDKVEGRITRCADFGAFVEVEPGIEGLVHISEMSHVKRVVKAEDEVRPGDKVAVTVKSVDPAKKRMSLSMKDAEGDPWLTIENRLSVGQTVSGRIEKKADFGYFINLAPGITGLLPKSKIHNAPDPQAIEKLNTDDPISVTIEAMDRQDKKITLAAADAVDQTDIKKYASDASAKKATGMGALGEKLQEALKSKK